MGIEEGTTGSVPKDFRLSKDYVEGTTVPTQKYRTNHHAPDHGIRVAS